MEETKGTKKVLISLIIVIFLILVVLVFYLVLSNFNKQINEKSVSDSVLELTYKGEKYIDGLKRMSDEDAIKSDGYIFSLTNNGTMPMKYSLYITGTNLIEHASNIKILRNDNPVFLTSLPISDKGILISSGKINGANTQDDNELYSIKIWLDEYSNIIHDDEIKMVIKGEVILNLATDIIKSIDSEDIMISKDNLPKYIAGSNNYVKIDDKLWRIIGLFKDNDYNYYPERVLVIENSDDVNYNYNSSKDYIIKRNENASLAEKKYFDQTAFIDHQLFSLPNTYYYDYIKNWDEFNFDCWVGDANMSVYTKDGIKKKNSINTAQVKLIGYLKPTVEIVDGLGTIDDPYIIK